MNQFKFYFALVLMACVGTAHANTSVYDVPMSPELRKNVSIFNNPELIKITDRVYLAYAFDLVNCVFIVGDDGILVIDTLARVENARRALDQLREITEKPVVAMIYSHGHFDHTGGSAAFVSQEAAGDIPVYASVAWPRYRQELASPLYPMIGRRMIEQIGFAVVPPGTERYEHILGPVRPTARTQSYIEPNRTVSEPTRVVLAGVELDLIPIPSEMDDELIVWIPNEGVAYGADTMAHVFPFLATPRSEPSRSPRGLIKAKDIMLDWQPQHLLLGHGPPTSGKQKVRERLTAYRDAEQSLLDQTIAAINAGMTRDEAAEQIRLPTHLARDPMMNDAYHRASWVIKGLYTRLSGWYGNDALEFIQHPPREEAKRMIRLAGGAEKMLERAREAMHADDYSWAAQLATYLLLGGQQTAAAKRIEIDAFKSVAARTHSSNERYYLLSGALWLERGGTITPPLGVADQTSMVPTSEFVEFLGPRLDLKRSAVEVLKVNFEIRDTGENFRITVRRGVLERRAGLHNKPDLTLSMDRQSLLAFTAKLTPSQELLQDGKIQAKGDAERFLKLFN